jgi:hypothetical protein
MDIAAASRFPIDRADGMFSFCSHVNRNPWRGQSARLAGAGPLRLGSAGRDEAGPGMRPRDGPGPADIGLDARGWVSLGAAGKPPEMSTVWVTAGRAFV